MRATRKFEPFIATLEVLAASRSANRLLVVTRLLAVEFVMMRLLAVELQNSCRADKMTETVVVLQGVSW